MSIANYIMIFDNSGTKSGIILKDNKENKLNYIFSLAAFNKGFTEIKKLDGEEQELASQWMNFKIAENFTESSKIFKKIQAQHSLVAIYHEDEIVLRPIRKQLENGEFPIAKSFKIQIV